MERRPAVPRAVALRAQRLDADTATAMVGAALKHREEQQPTAWLDLGQLLERALTS